MRGKDKEEEEKEEEDRERGGEYTQYLTELIQRQDTGLSGWRYSILWTGGSSGVTEPIRWEKEWERVESREEEIWYLC